MTSLLRTVLIRLRWWRRKRRRQAESHRAEVGNDGVDGVPVLVTAKRPPELQITTHFEYNVSGTSKRHSLDDKLITHGPKRPSKDRNEQPPKWRLDGVEAWTSVRRSGKLVLHRLPLTTSRRQPQRNWAETHEKKM